MWTILDAADFLDPPLAFTDRKNDGYFSFNAISVYKVYIDFWINTKEAFCECSHGNRQRHLAMPT